MSSASSLCSSLSWTDTPEADAGLQGEVEALPKSNKYSFLLFSSKPELRPAVVSQQNKQNLFVFAYLE